jgi:hypothetical protein
MLSNLSFGKGVVADDVYGHDRFTLAGVFKHGWLITRAILLLRTHRWETATSQPSIAELPVSE